VTAAEARRLVAQAGRVLGANGHADYIWGHVALRDPAGRGMWMKRSGLGFDEVTDADVLLLDLADGAVLDGAGRAHLEWPIHAAVLTARPDVAATVHTHPEHALAVAAAGVPLLAVGQAGTAFAPDDLPRFDATTRLIDSLALGEQVAARLGDAPAVLLVNHGIVTVGEDLPTAVARAVVLEDACRQQVLAASLGGARALPTQEDALATRDTSWSPAAMHGLWDYLVRRLPQTAEAS